MDRFKVAENKTIRADDRDYIFLVADKAIFEMDAQTKTVLDELTPKGALSRQEIMDSLACESNGEPEELFRGLLKRRVIVPSNNGMFVSQKATPHNLSIPLKTLILHLTDACNLNCRYCYHSEGDLKKSKKKVMGLEVACRAVDFLFDHAGQLEEVVLVFFGGEPLLNFGIIPTVVDYASQKAAEKGKRINFAITTNGTLLSDEIIAFFQDKSIGVTVSIDGFARVQDRYRRFADGTPTYETMLPKIKRLLTRFE